MKKLILLILVGLMLGGCLKSPEPIGTILVEYVGKNNLGEECRKIINYPYFAFSPETKSYQISHVFYQFMPEQEYLAWITKDQNFDIWSAGKIDGYVKIFDTSEIGTMYPKQVTLLNGANLTTICITKETDKAYGYEKNKYSTVWISKIPNEEWFGMKISLWEDGDRVKEGKVRKEKE